MARPCVTECECGAEKAPGDRNGCPRCKALQADIADIRSKWAGIAVTLDGFADVNAACTKWLRDRGLPIGDRIIPFNPLS